VPKQHWRGGTKNRLVFEKTARFSTKLSDFGGEMDRFSFLVSTPFFISTNFVGHITPIFLIPF
jgi:hypothetical protein